MSNTRARDTGSSDRADRDGRFPVFPLLLGEKGKDSIFARAPNLELELVDTQVLDSRVIAVDYAPRSGGQSDR
jgi:hypothetical protein